MRKYNKYTMNTIFIYLFIKEKNHTALHLPFNQIHFFPDSYHLHSSPNRSVFMLRNPVRLTLFSSQFIPVPYYSRGCSEIRTNLFQPLLPQKRLMSLRNHRNVICMLTWQAVWTQVQLQPSRHATCTVFPEESLTREWSRQTGHPNDHASGRAERFSSWRCFWFVDLSCFAVS